MLFLLAVLHVYCSNATTSTPTGGAGCDEMTYLEDADVAQQMYAEGWAVPHGSEQVASGRISTGLLRANATSLHFRLIDSADGSVIDQTVITKSAQDHARDAMLPN